MKLDCAYAGLDWVIIALYFTLLLDVAWWVAQPVTIRLSTAR